MAFEIKTPPEFTVEIEQWNRETLADGIEMSKLIEKLLNNTIYNKHQRECQNHTTLVFLAASGWIGETAPYVQTASVDGAKDGPEPLLVSALTDGASLETQKAYVKAFSILCGGTATLGEGVATFKVYKKPVTDITIGLRGVGM